MTIRGHHTSLDHGIHAWHDGGSLLPRRTAECNDELGLQPPSLDDGNGLSNAKRRDGARYQPRRSDYAAKAARFLPACLAR